jgi:hypothetical protein
MKKNTAILVSFLLFFAFSCTKGRESDIYSNGEKIEKITYTRSGDFAINSGDFMLEITADSINVSKFKYDSIGNNPVYIFCSRSITSQEWLDVLPNDIDPYFEQAANKVYFCGTGTIIDAIQVKTSLRDDFFGWINSRPEGAAGDIGIKAEALFGGFIKECQ